MIHRLAERKYCKCDDCIKCGCSRWWEHHSSTTEIVPNTLRPFDESRHVLESLWSSVKKKGAVTLDTIAEGFRNAL